MSNPSDVDLQLPFRKIPSEFDTNLLWKAIGTGASKTLFGSFHVLSGSLYQSSDDKLLSKDVASSRWTLDLFLKEAGSGPAKWAAQKNETRVNNLELEKHETGPNHPESETYRSQRLLYFSREVDGMLRVELVYGGSTVPSENELRVSEGVPENQEAFLAYCPMADTGEGPRSIALVLISPDKRSAVLFANEDSLITAAQRARLLFQCMK